MAKVLSVVLMDVLLQLNSGTSKEQVYLVKIQLNPHNTCFEAPSIQIVRLDIPLHHMRPILIFFSDLQHF